MRRTTARTWGAALVAAALHLAAMADGDAPQWRAVDGPGETLKSWDGREIGAGAPNPYTDVGVEGLRGRWLRLSGDADEPTAGMQFTLTAFQDKAIIARSYLATCKANGHQQTHCTGVLWLPPEATRLRLVAWASLAPGHIHNVVFESMDAVPSTGQLDRRLADLVDTIQAEYYRRHEVDWSALRARLAAMPPPPPDFDPLPGQIRQVVSALPGNKHTFLMPSMTPEMQRNALRLPICRRLADDAWLLHLPGAVNIVDSDLVRAYADAAHRCLAQAPAAARWIVDLRGNGGGNMNPMLAAVDAFFADGPLLTFVDGAGARTGRVDMSAAGIVQDGDLTVALNARTAQRAATPVVVLVDQTCASSCEVMAITFRSRPATRLVGQPTAGFTTGNVGIPVDDHYNLLLTVNYMGDRCGRPVPERIPPDVAIDPKDETAALAQLRAMRPDAPASAPCAQDGASASAPASASVGATSASADNAGARHPAP